MGQIVGRAAKPKRCNLNKLSQLGTPAAGEHILVSSDNSMNAAGQGDFDCYIVGDGTKAATALPLIKTYANDADNEPTAGSDKLVKSGGVAAVNGSYVENPEWIRVITDKNDRILCGIKADGSIEWSVGVPTPVKEWVSEKIDELSLDEYEDIVAFLNGLLGGQSLSNLLDGKVDKENNKGIVPLQYLQELETDEYIHAIIDKDDKILLGIKKDGDVQFGRGVPTQITTALESVKAEAVAETKDYVDAELDDVDLRGNLTNNIVYRNRLDNISENTEIIVNIGDREYKNYIYVGVFASSYTVWAHTYNIYKSADGETFTFIKAWGCNEITRITLEEDIKFIKIVTRDISASVNLGVNIWNHYDGDIKVASSTSSARFKEEALFVCDGVNDEIELDEAITLAGFHNKILLGAGTFYIDAFIEKQYTYSGVSYTDYGVMTLFNYQGVTTRKAVEGVGREFNESPSKGTRIFVRDSAFDSVPDDSEPYVIGCSSYGTTSTLVVKNLFIKVENNQHKVVCINGQRLGAMIVDNCSLSAGANAWSETIPAEGCVGLRGVMGDCNGTNYYIAHTYANAFYEGFQLGGEHLVMIECGGRFNYYCYTFGNYDYGSAYNSGAVTDSHPLTLINCCDEGSRALPKFVKSGMYSDGNVATKQQIDLIGFNMEVHTASLQGAVEVTPGAFCGTIDFVAYGSTNSSKNTPPPNRGNRVDTKFWATDDDGKYFRTTNATHAEKGSTAERLGYWAQNMQRYFDIDLNKLLVCTSSDAQEWRDCSGNIIND